MLRWIAKTMFQGLAALIPVGVTLVIILWLGIWIESLFANPLQDLFPGSSEIYRMGMGIASFLLLLFCFGLLMKLWLVRKMVEMVEGWLAQLPVVKTVFGAIKDIMKFLGAGNGGMGDMVVMVTMENGWRQLGIVTRQDFTHLPPALQNGNPDVVAVYLPFSYQLGGFTYFIDRSRCAPVPGMSVENAMRYSMMAWLGSDTAAPAPEKTSDNDAAS